MAGKVIEELRRTCKYCPTDAEIFAAAEKVSAQTAPPVEWPPKWKPMGHCPVGQCDGSGWVIVTVAGVEASKPCACRAKSSGSAA